MTRPTLLWWQAEAVKREALPYRALLAQVEAEILEPKKALASMRQMMRTKAIGLLYDPRLGKTGTAFSIYRAMDEVYYRLQFLANVDPEPLHWLLIVPNTLTTIWSEQEADKWLEPHEKQSIVTIKADGSDGREFLLKFAELVKPRFVVVTYDFFSRQLDPKQAENREHLAKQAAKEIGIILNMKFDAVLFDEIHALGDPSSLRSQNIEMLPVEEMMRLMLSGTPIPNRIDKAQAPLGLMHPGELEVMVDPLKRTYKALSQLTPAERVQHYTPTNRMYRKVSPVWGSRDVFLDTYSESAEGSYGSRTTAGANLTAGTCHLCKKSRCSNVVNARGYKSQCRYYHLTALQRQKICRNCQEPVPADCQACPRPFYNKLVSLGFDRKTKDQCLTGSMSEFENVLCPMTTAQRALYENAKEGVIAFKNQLGQMSKFQATQCKLAIITDMRMIATDPEQWYAGLAHRQNTGGAEWLENIKPPTDRRSGKVEWLKAFFEDDLDELEETKVLLFSEWATTARILQREFSQYAPALLVGGMKQSDFDAEKVRFNENDDCRMLIATSTGFQGIDLSAKGETGYVVMINPFWVPGATAQATERATNPQWPRTVQVLHMLSEKSVDGIIQKRLVRKQMDIDGAIDDYKVDRAGTFDSVELDDILDNL